MSNMRNLTYDEAVELFDKLRFVGYPAQMWYHDNKWKVQVEQMITNKKANIDTF